LNILLPILLAISGAPIFGGARPVPFNPARVRHGEWGAALVALAGPLTNFVFAFVSFGLFVLSGMNEASLFGRVLLISTMVNLGFFVFNMIPFPPLDGSRVLYAIAPDFVRQIMTTIEQMGILAIFVIVMLASNVIGGFMITMMTAIIRLFSLIFGV